MAIRLDPEAVDAQGLPVVSWEEDRNAFAPEGFGQARITCFLRPDAAGVLQFVAAGSVRHGEFEEARSWELLLGFERSSAEQHYNSASDRALLDMLASKSKSGAGRLLLTDGAQVMLANFRDERASVATHLNCADASPVEVALLHDRLHREFIVKRDAVFREMLDEGLVWTKAKPPFVAHVPPAPASVSRWMVRLIDLSIFAALGLGFLALYRLLYR